MKTTIRLNVNVKEKLDSLKVHSRESYNDVLLRMLKECKNMNLDDDSLKETIEILGSPETMRNLAEALAQINKENYGTSLEDVEKELGLKNV